MYTFLQVGDGQPLVDAMGAFCIGDGKEVYDAV